MAVKKITPKNEDNTKVEFVVMGKGSYGYIPLYKGPTGNKYVEFNTEQEAIDWASEQFNNPTNSANSKIDNFFIFRKHAVLGQPKVPVELIYTTIE